MMKKAFFTAIALTAAISATSPAFAKHHGHHHHKKTSKIAKAPAPQAAPSAATEDLNASSLQKAQTPVAAPVQAPAAPAPVDGK